MILSAGRAASRGPGRPRKQVNPLALLTAIPHTNNMDELLKAWFDGFNVVPAMKNWSPEAVRASKSAISKRKVVALQAELMGRASFIQKYNTFSLSQMYNLVRTKKWAEENIGHDDPMETDGLAYDGE